MPITFIISEVKENDFGLYFECFNNSEFIDFYSLALNKSNNQNIHDIAFNNYLHLQRFVIKFNNRSICFCHFLEKNNNIYVSGGITPELFNSGIGVFCAVIIYDFYITSFHPEYLNVEIKKSNLRSIKLHEALGFNITNHNITVKMELNSTDFPNDFAKYLLNRISYEKK